MMRKGNRFPRIAGLALAIALLSASCGGDEPLSEEEAIDRLSSLADDIDWVEDFVGRRASVTPAGTTELSDTLPPIDEYPLVVDEPRSSRAVVAEIFVSTEKSGEGTDGWMVEVAEAFNREDERLADGTEARVAIRKIASGIGFQFIAAQEYLPDGFSPSNHLWIKMAAASGIQMTPVRESLVSNVAGVVMQTEEARALEQEYGALDVKTVIDAVIQGRIVMGYTNPYASSTGLNFLVTILSSFSDGQEERFLSPDVVSTLERFQRNVPFVALTTLQIRESVESETGSLDAFVMEYQTFVNTDSLASGFEFVPFGIRHDNPLYAVGDLSPEKRAVLELFAAFAQRSKYRDLAAGYGFSPPRYDPEVVAPSGDTLIAAQRLWKEKKDAGRPIAAIFVADVSNSMFGPRIQAVQEALLSGSDFITTENSVGLVEFSDEVRVVLPIGPFDLNQKGSFVAAVQDMSADGGTAMYDGIVVGLQLLIEETVRNPDVKPLLFVLTDGETNEGLGFDDARRVIEGVGIPVYTVGFEADIEELSRLSSLVEAASLDAGVEDVEYTISSLFNAEL